MRNSDRSAVLFPTIRDQFHQAAKLAERLANKDRFALAFTACRHGAGTSTIAANFAAAFVETVSSSLVLVEANFRAPTFRETFALAPGPGLVELLAGEAELGCVVHNHPELAGVSIVPAGTLVADPSALLTKSRLRRAMTQLRESFDVVLLDTAPLIAYPDTLAIGGEVDGVALVVEADGESQEVVSRATDIMRSAGVALIGVILNRRRYFIPRWLYRLL